MKIGLALQGGGAKGAYQAGAIKAFNERKIKFDGVVGTSIGAINAAFYASNNCIGLEKLWKTTDSKYLLGIESKLLDDFDDRKLNKNDIVKGLESIVKIIKNKGIDISNIKEILNNNINEEVLRKSDIDFGLVTFRLSDMKPIKITKKDIPEGKLIEYIIASAYLPCFKFERIIDDSYYFDGGIYSNCPVDMLMDNGYDEIYVVKAWEGDKLKYKKKDNVKVTIISSNEKLGSIISFSPRKAERKMKLGYYDTLKVLDNLDGNKYYFKYKSDEFYNNLLDKDYIKKLHIKYKDILNIKSTKELIINLIEEVLIDKNKYNLRIYNMSYIIIYLKITNNKKNKYYKYIKNMKII